ncbi:carbohydrate ABC transporter membrane protein 1 (CUT1 family) [Streptomyces sp. 846.5]|nr:sugar ABC transporter permease [Streptomyces sp. 846.5]TDT97478.1 carbohydrate ABC transporter membrane protein 1 (CUT1 family) [Streptomyces sp. 846.5]
MTTEVEPRPTADRAPDRGPRTRSRRGRTGAVKGLLFTLPFAAGFLFVYVAPVGYAVFQSLHQEKHSGLGFGAPHTVFSGWANFGHSFGDPSFWGGMARVAAFGVVEIPVMLGVALVMALLLDSAAARAVRLFRLGYLVPYAIPAVVATLVWMYLYSPVVSPITDTLGHLGVHGFTFFGPVGKYVSVGNVLVWEQIGFNMILISAALQAVPKELFEAARIDGASESRIAWSIKVPAVRPVLVLTGMFSIIGALQLFGEPLILRQEAPGAIGTDFTPMQMIYTTAFQTANYDYASALSIVLAVVTGVLAFVFYRITNRRTAI